MTRRSWIVAAVAVASLVALPAVASAKKPETVVVCKRGCEFRSIQKAVDKTGKNATIKVKPGKYVEGVVVQGKKHSGLTIKGTSKNAKDVVLEGKNAKSPFGPAQNGIEAIDVPSMSVMNLTVQNFLTNGLFFRDDSTDNEKYGCRDYLMKNILAKYNRAYGLFSFGCLEGRMTQSTGIGHGDAAFYVGATPPKPNLKWTVLDKLDAHINIQAFSGTNSRKIEIKDSNFYNNGLGLIPNTLDSEPYEPATVGKIHDNNIFWNNYNYYLPASKVKTISNGLGTIGEPPNELTINFPTGVGIGLFGVTGWEIYDNNIFGHYKWGVGVFSDPVGNDGGDALSTDNQVYDNEMGRGGSDVNAVDFFNDGSGSGNCFEGNTSSSFDPSPTATNDNLYPLCPAPAPPASGTGTIIGNFEQQFGDLADYVTSTPPEDQECSWTKAPHPAYKSYEPEEVPGAECGP